MSQSNIQNFTATWFYKPINLSLAEIFIETEFGAVKTISVNDPADSILNGELGVFLPQLTDDFRRWKNIAHARAKEAGVTFLVSKSPKENNVKTRKRSDGNKELQVI